MHLQNVISKYLKSALLQSRHIYVARVYHYRKVTTAVSCYA